MEGQMAELPDNWRDKGDSGDVTGEQE